MTASERGYLEAIAARLDCSLNYCLRYMIRATYARLPDIPDAARFQATQEIPTRPYMTLTNPAMVGQLAVDMDGDDSEGSNDTDD